MLYKIINLDNTALNNRFKHFSLIDTEIDLSPSEEALLSSGQSIEKNGVSLTYKNLERLEEETGPDNNLRKKVIGAIADKFYNVESQSSCLIDAFLLGYNVLFYGRGGYGKSEVSKEFFDILYREGIIDEKPFVMSLSEGTTDDELFGGTNIKKLQEEGIIEYNIENSFMMHKYVVFEEMFDAHPQALLSLKDILTSKEFRKGNQCVPIKTKMVIGLTNKPKTDFGTDDSKSALLDRFPFSNKFEWENPTVVDYFNLFNKVKYTEDADILKEYSKLADIIYNYNSKCSGHISPRIALVILNTHLKGYSLRNIEGLDSDAIEMYEKKMSNDKGINNLSRAIQIREDMIRTMDHFKVGSTKLVTPTVTTMLTIEYVIHRLKELNPDDFEYKTPIIIEPEFTGHDTDFQDYINSLEDELEELINNEEDEILKEQITLELAYIQLLYTEAS